MDKVLSLVPSRNPPVEKSFLFKSEITVSIISSNFFLFEDVKKGILYEIVTVASSVVIFAFFKLDSSFNISIKDLCVSSL